MYKLYYSIMTEEEINVIMEALELCMDTIKYKKSIVEFDPIYDSQYYCELGSEYIKYETMLNKLKTIMNEDENE